jgi:hypothetical protein
MKMIKLKLTDLILRRRAAPSRRMEAGQCRLRPSFETPATRAPQDEVDGMIATCSNQGNADLKRFPSDLNRRGFPMV